MAAVAAAAVVVVGIHWCVTSQTSGDTHEWTRTGRFFCCVLWCDDVFLVYMAAAEMVIMVVGCLLCIFV